MAASGASLRSPGTQGDHFRALRRTPTGLSICCRQPSSRGVVIVTQSVPRQLHGAQAEHACVGFTLAACLRQRRSCSTGAAAAAGISSAITTTAVPALLASWRADPCRLLLSIAASLVGIAVSAALIAAIPAILVSLWMGDRPGGPSKSPSAQPSKVTERYPPPVLLHAARHCHKLLEQPPLSS